MVGKWCVPGRPFHNLHSRSALGTLTDCVRRDAVRTNENKIAHFLRNAHEPRETRLRNRITTSAVVLASALLAACERNTAGEYAPGPVA